MENQIHCPKCGSTQITANKKGFSGKKAVAGAVLTGGIGILAGTIGSNKVVITCLNCGNQFKPGGHQKQHKVKIEWKDLKNKDTRIAFNKRVKTNKIIGWVFFLLFAFFGIIFIFSDLIIAGVVFILFSAFFLLFALAKKIPIDTTNQ